jgi:hypothetical protein
MQNVSFPANISNTNEQPASKTTKLAKIAN